MKEFKEQSIAHRGAFTLVEMLTVITIIAILAALIVPLAGNAIAKARLERARTELKQLETVIEDYKSSRGHYPPDNQQNPRNLAAPPLFYELVGTVHTETYPTPKVFRRINGVEQIIESDVTTAFGISGFVNSSHVQNAAAKDQIREAEVRDFFPTIGSKQYLEVDYLGKKVVVLGLPIDGPNDLTSSDNRKINPWRYNSSSPTNSPNTYDLWMDILIRGKTNRICNWSDVPVIVN